MPSSTSINLNIKNLREPEEIEKSLSEGLYPFHLEYVPFRHLFVDGYESIGSQAKAKYQRSVEKQAKKAKREGFSPLLFQPLLCNRRNSHKVAVLDGGTRLKMLGDELGFGIHQDAEVPCLVFTNKVEPEEEALVYMYVNGDRQGLNAVDLFVAGRAAGLPTEVNIHQLVLSASGLEIGPRTSQLHCVQSIRDLYSHDEGKDDHGRALRETFRLLKASGWTQGKVPTNNLVGGVGRIVRQTIDQPEIYGETYDRLLKVMSKTTGEAVNDICRPSTGGTAVSRNRARLVAIYLGKQVNKGLRSRHLVDVTQWAFDDEDDD